MEVDGVIVVCGRNECMLVIQLLCMSVSICNYAYIEMVIVVVHEVMVCGWYSHAW